MTNLATTKMSSKGQVVIPEEIRKQLHLKPGSRFIIVGDGDVVILKEILPPSMREFNRLIADARRRAKQSGMKRSDIKKALSVARRHG
ncbi:MAG: AbrB/MazE/SpoVT family DNA-binding domain-containing protein [Candidatus Eisenbacteria bacterium]|nr:AbrB/MazE/SpoVT family DNA-binding domain-containing protein [Candidatus Eisenbacteria bacterium]